MHWPTVSINISSYVYTDFHFANIVKSACISLCLCLFRANACRDLDENWYGNTYNRFRISSWHLSRQHLSWPHMSISGISQLLLTWFWWNIKGRFLGTSRTDSNCHSDICPCNICLCDICPYQEYFSYYWPNFDQTLKLGFWDHL